MSKIELKAIGKVHADDSAGRYVLEVSEPYREGLLSLEEFGRIQVLWWVTGMDTPEMRGTLTCELPYAPGTRAGVFSCRAEYRPNPIGLTSCGVLEVRRKEGIVVLDYIDAFDGTPVLDIKPYIPSCDRAREVKVAPWFRSWPEWMEDSGEFFAQENAPKT